MSTKPIRRVTFKKAGLILSLRTGLADNEYNNRI